MFGEGAPCKQDCPGNKINKNGQRHARDQYIERRESNVQIARVGIGSPLVRVQRKEPRIAADKLADAPGLRSIASRKHEAKHEGARG